MLKRPRSVSPSSECGGNFDNAGSLSSKRPNTWRSNEHGAQVTQNAKRSVADLFPFQEIFLRILSFLSPNELASIQSVDKYWAKMSLDPQLWKRLYLARYPHPHHSRLIYTDPQSLESSVNDANALSSPRTPKSLRPIARLPSRAFPPPSPRRSPALAEGQLTPRSTPSRKQKGREVDEVNSEVGHGIRNDGVDWKLMLRLGTNWQSSAIPPLTLSPSSASESHQTHHRDAGISEQYIALSPSYIFIASPFSPLVQVHSSSSTSNTPIGIIPPPPGWSNPKRPDNITCVVSDQSVLPPDDTGDSDSDRLPTRIAVFYQSGGFVTLIISPNARGVGITWKREFVNNPGIRPPSLRSRTYGVNPGDPVVLASLHYPVLVSCTKEFNLSMYSLTSPSQVQSESGQIRRPRHLQTLKSQVSFHPAILTLFPTHSPSSSPSPFSAGSSAQDEKNETDQFKVSLTYCTPLYPASWTIAVQEFSVDLFSNNDVVRRGESFHVGRNDEDDEIIWPRKIKPLVGVKRKAVGIGSDGRWCILVGDRDDKIQVFSLPHSHDDQQQAAKIRPRSHVRNQNEQKSAIDVADQPIIHSQTLSSKYHSDITSLALHSGRCVSSNKEGKLLIWELDDEEEVDPATTSTSIAASGKMGKMIGYVEVKQGGRRSIWRGATGPQVLEREESLDIEGAEGPSPSSRTMWPHPQSISSAARSLFLPRPAIDMSSVTEQRDRERKPPIRYLTFDEEKIVGVVSANTGVGEGNGRGHGIQEEVMKIWNFS
uniref:F-box domain-containing protein n=1 Tax=Kwoniella dejecticola CBS 10117 TaxID=1296121 RepID=A0A1A5ZXN2_9TREE|nr:uncharacterized protein I303_07328 [Kwoniella dejecticola CBS 10117]OBR82567.1 hypothetical protein I303_07328 [Kwoniella dejecticola CBS 10117]